MLRNVSDKKSQNQQPESVQTTPVQSDDTAKNSADPPRFVAPTHEGVDILKLLTELEDLVENTPHGPFGTLLRFNEDAFHMTIMKIRANLPEEMKRASKLARDSERLAEETRENADRVIGDARQAARAELERGRAEIAQSRALAQEEAKRLAEEAQVNARRLQEEAQGDIQRVRDAAEREAQRLVTEAREESVRILGVAQEQAAQAVGESEIMQQAKAKEQELLGHATQEADAIRRGADDYARDVLGNLETVLGKAMTQVQRGREMLDR